MKARAFAAILLLAGSICSFAQNGATPPASANQSAHPPATGEKSWFVRLIPPRTTFPQDMTEREKKLMEDHYAYWKGRFEAGVCVFGGPVMDPRGVYGVLAIRAATEDEAHAIASADPSVKAGLMRLEVAEMEIAFLPPVPSHN
jgi:uncharacterized protein YciI